MRVKLGMKKEIPFGAKGDLRKRNISTERVESVGRHRRLGFGVGRKNPFGCRER